METKGLKLTRNFITNLPKFRNCNEAEDYFKNLFGDLFLPYRILKADNERVYLYHLILNRTTYKKGATKLRERKWSLKDEDCCNYLNSYQPIEIDDSGIVQIL